MSVCDHKFVKLYERGRIISTDPAGGKPTGGYQCDKCGKTTYCTAKWDGVMYNVGDEWFSYDGDNWTDGSGLPVAGTDGDFDEALILFLDGPREGESVL